MEDPMEWTFTNSSVQLDSQISQIGSIDILAAESDKTDRTVKSIDFKAMESELKFPWKRGSDLKKAGSNESLTSAGSAEYKSAGSAVLVASSKRDHYSDNGKVAKADSGKVAKFRQALDKGLSDLKRQLLQDYDRQFGVSNHSKKSDTPHTPRQPSPRRISLTPKAADKQAGKDACLPKQPLRAIPEVPALSVRTTPRLRNHEMVVIHADGDGTSPRNIKRVDLLQSSAVSFEEDEQEQRRPTDVASAKWHYRGSSSSMGTAFFGEDNALTRWHRVCSSLLLLRPRQSNGNKSLYKMHDWWRQQLTALKKNDPSKNLYVTAMQKIRSSRRHSLHQASSSITLSTSNSMTSTMSWRPQSFVSHPSSTFRLMWVLLSCVVFLSDTALLPVNAFFDVKDSGFFRFALTFGSVFLALDMVANCTVGTYIHGVLEMRLKSIVKEYVKTWFSFDLTLTLIDWILTLVELISESVGNVIRIIQIIRLLRLVRLIRLEATLQSSFGLSSKNMLVWCNIIKTVFIYATYFHVLACIWYGISKAQDRGWVAECSSESHFRCYVSCFHWALSQVHGTTHREYTTSTEWGFATVSLLVGFVLLALFLGTICHAVAMLTNVDKLEVRLRCIRYTEVHQLSAALAHRLLQYVDSCRLQVNLAQRVQQENEILHNLPISLQSELLYEARSPLLRRVSIFQDLHFLSASLVKSMCSEAIRFTVFMGGERVFCTGDQGTHWRSVDSGGFVYISAQAMWAELALAVFKSRPSVFSSDSSGCSNNVLRGQSISEMVLWTAWNHTGDLSVTSDGIVIELTMKAFADALKERADACWMVAYYAQRYVRHLCVVQGDVTDLYEHSPMDAGPEENDSMSHLIFLSHYKAEAGTEATLMQEGLTKLMAGDNVDCEEAVFLDSEDLANLTDLRDHVVNSRSLVLLLTPGVLLRPWCLVELVTAATYGVQIVPVEIQRPGMRFKYPDEEFYSRVRSGKLLPVADRKLLDSEGITLSSLEAAVRSLFTEISLPFSPHKSKNIREAELNDIMKRCNCLQKAAPLSNNESMELMNMNA